jgi:glycine/D-amino acid oxidase-like deaminating enzyme
MDFERQRALSLKIPKSVWVVGCGGVGYWTAYQLALSGVPELVLFDPDTISDSNYNRIPYTYEDRGRNKAEVLAEHIKRIRPGTIVVPCDWAFAADTTIDTPPQWLIATTDTWKSRQMCAEWAKKYNVQYLEAAAEGEYGSLTASPADFATPDEENPGYASVPVWAGPVLSAGLLACAHVIHAKTPEFEAVRMGWNGRALSLENL